MTRLAILADIHGNLPALEAVSRDFKTEQVDQVIVAGDAVHWGPSSAAVVDMIVREGWAVVRGNNEFYAVDYGTHRAPAAWSGPDFRSLAWLNEELGDERRAIIATWPDTLSLRFADAPTIRVVHGSPRSNSESIFSTTPEEEIGAMLAGTDDPFVITGHTHLPMYRQAGAWWIYNPGSVGIPLDGISAAQYLILDSHPTAWDWIARRRRVEYDRTPLFDALDRARLPERCGPVGELIVEEFRTNRMWVHAFVNWRNRHHPGEPFTDAHLAAFRQTDRWLYTEPEYHVNRDVD